MTTYIEEDLVDLSPEEKEMARIASGLGPFSRLAQRRLYEDFGLLARRVAGTERIVVSAAIDIGRYAICAEITT